MNVLLELMVARLVCCPWQNEQQLQPAAVAQSMRSTSLVCLVLYATRPHPCTRPLRLPRTLSTHPKLWPQSACIYVCVPCSELDRLCAFCGWVGVSAYCTMYVIYHKVVCLAGWMRCLKKQSLLYIVECSSYNISIFFLSKVFT